MRLRLLAVLVTGFSLCAETGPPVPDIGAIWATHWSAKKLDQVMALYTQDAIFFATDGARFAGAPAIRDFFQKTLATNDPTIHTHRVATEQSGKLAYESGEYKETIVSGGQGRDFEGHYLLVLRNQNGHWLIAEQMWTGGPAPIHNPN
jgi:ketosteroid isomerase-like protein